MAQRICGCCGMRAIVGVLACVAVLLVPLMAVAFFGSSIFTPASPTALDRSDDVVAQGMLIHIDGPRTVPTGHAAQVDANSDSADVLLNNWTYTEDPRVPTRRN
jgi:hypothetical protein